MARPRTPVETLAVTGGYKNNPGRFKERHGNSPKDDRPLGDPPAAFTDEQAEAWRELESYAPAGVLKAADRHVVEIAARALASLREPTMEIVGKNSEGATITLTVDKPFDNKAATTLKACLVSMGLTPVDRSKVKLDAPDEKEPTGFDALGPPN